MKQIQAFVSCEATGLVGLSSIVLKTWNYSRTAAVEHHDDTENQVSKDFDRKAVSVFKALGDTNRYKILRLLLENGELSCADFDDRIELSKPAMSHHYRILENAGLIDVRKKGLHFYMKANLKVLEKFVPNFVETHVKR